MNQINHAHIASFIYKLITSARDTDDLSIGFDRDCDGRQHELTNNKTKKRKILCEKYAQRCSWFCRTSRKSYLRIRM